MNPAGITRWPLVLLGLAALLVCDMPTLREGMPPAAAQEQRFQWPPGLPASGPFELSEAVQLDLVPSKLLADLERAKAYLADHQWAEAVDTLCQVMAGDEGKLVEITERRYVGLQDYVNLQLAALPPEALQLYRSRVDPVAGQWYKEGIAKRDRRLLAKVAEQAFASSWGDDALLALGDMSLEAGDYAAARWQWERIVPSNPPPQQPRTWPSYPDTQLDLAAVRARLVLVSILEGATGRAREELAQFTRLHPDARGRLGGQEVNYAEALAGLLAESAAWPPEQQSGDWPTFAGNTQRNKIAPQMVDTAGVAWRIALLAAAAEPRPTDPPLSFYPLLVDNLILVNNSREIFAVDVQTGKPAWGQSGASIFRAEFEGVAGEPSRPADALGVPRYTMTACDGKLYARMGTTVTTRPQEALWDIRPGYLVALDLKAEGRLMWKLVPEEGWALEGSPVADGSSVYVAMRRNDVSPQAYVACLDAQTGQRRWRRLICSAETPARGVFYQHTHNLLTLEHDTLYYNTNLGAVAALSTGEGRLLWVSLYPRALRGDVAELAPHWQRDLNPCLFDQGTLLVAPADSPRIFALDAATGQILWQTGTEVEDVLHLLGTTGKHLIASGERLYWIALTRGLEGRVEHVWPEGQEKLGYGRGVLAADCVLWPSREKVYVLDQQTAEPKTVIDLVPHGVTGGNLLAADGRLLITTGSELVAMNRYGGPPQKAPAGRLSSAPHPMDFLQQEPK